MVEGQLLTGPHIGLITEKRAKVLPLRRIAIYWPTLAQLRNGESVQDFRLFAIDV